MNSMLTFKLPQSLLHQLEAEAQNQGISKGALVREAVQSYFKKTTRNQMEKIKRATLRLIQGKKSKNKLKIEEIRAELAKHPTTMTPEEEVRYYRDLRHKQL